MQACFPYLKKHGGKVINLASGAGVSGTAGFTAYASAKEAIRALSRVAANEWGQYGINVNVLCPFANSPGVQLWAEAFPDQIQANLALVPMGRIGDCEMDAGRVVVFLASSDSDYMTGQTIDVDGGRLIRP